VPLRRLRVDHLDRFYEDLATIGGRRGIGLSSKTVHEVHLIIRAALGAAVIRGLVDLNVAHDAHTRLPCTAGTTAMVWSAAELAAFLDAARAHRLYPLLHLTAHSGIRRGEVVGLKWSDLDLNGQWLSVQRTLQCVGGRPVEEGVKTRTSRRCIDLDSSTLDELARWRQRLAREGHTQDPRGWMFCNEGGRLLNPESVSQLFARIDARATLPRIRFHDLRYTHASLLIAAGVPIKVVSERLGHAHPAFTTHTYQHVLPGMGAAAASTFASLIDAASR
jgi:integrase